MVATELHCFSQQLTKREIQETEMNSLSKMVFYEESLKHWQRATAQINVRNMTGS